MANMTVSDNKFVLPVSITESGTVEKTLRTAETYVEKDIKLEITVPDGDVEVTKAADGTVTPVIAVATDSNAAAGALTTSKPATGNYVAVKTEAIAASTKVEVDVTEGYVTDAKDTDVTVTRGAAASATAYIPLTDGTVTNAKAADGTVTPVIKVDTANTTVTAGTLTTTKPADGKYVAVKTDAIAASTKVTTTVTEGYVTAKNSTDITVTRGAAASATAYIPLEAGDVEVTKAADGTVTPVIKVADDSKAEVGTLTTTKPTSGNYVAVNTSAIAASTKVTVDVTEGYVTDAEDTDITVTRGAAAAATAYVPLTEMVLKNVADAGTDYTEISAPVLTEGGYLYLNEGYKGNTKISLATLVPDNANITSANANLVYNTVKAYDNDGALIVGTMSDATHTDTKGTLTTANATATASTTVADNAGHTVTGIKDSSAGLTHYLTIDGTAAQDNAGTFSQGVTCATSVGYVGTAIDNTTTVSGEVGVTVTAAATKYIKIYDGEIVE